MPGTRSRTRSFFRGEFGHELLPEYLAVSGRRKSPGISEKAAEIQGIVIADQGRDIADGIVGGLQQDLGIADPDLQQILYGGDADRVPEAAPEPACGHTAGCRVVFNADLFFVVILEICPCTVYFILDKTGDPGRFLGHAPVHGH